MTLPTPDTLATTFLALLSKQLTHDELAEVYRRNSSLPDACLVALGED